MIFLRIFARNSRNATPEIIVLGSKKKKIIVHIRIFVSNIGKDWVVTTLTDIVPGSPATNSDIDNSTLSSDHENEVSIFLSSSNTLLTVAISLYTLSQLKGL